MGTLAGGCQQTNPKALACFFTPPGHLFHKIFELNEHEEVQSPLDVLPPIFPTGDQTHDAR